MITRFNDGQLVKAFFCKVLNLEQPVKSTDSNRSQSPNVLDEMTVNSGQLAKLILVISSQSLNALSPNWLIWEANLISPESLFPEKALDPILLRAVNFEKLKSKVPTLLDHAENALLPIVVRAVHPVSLTVVNLGQSLNEPSPMRVNWEQFSIFISVKAEHD